MIDAIAQALERPAEGLALLLAAIALLGIGALRRRAQGGGPAASALPGTAPPGTAPPGTALPGTVLLGTVLLVGLGAWSASARELAAVAVVRQIPRGQLASHVAAAHAAAAGGLWWCLGLASLLCAAGHHARGGASAWPGRSVLAASALLALGALGAGAPELAPVALILLLSGSGSMLALLAGLLALGAAGCGAEAALARTLILEAPIEDLQRMGRTALAGWSCLGAVGAWLLGAWPALVRHRGGTLAALAIGAGIGATWLPAAERSRSWGPPERLRELGEVSAPPVSPGAERFVGGCVWRMGETGWRAEQIGRLSTAHAMTACPPGARAPRPQDRPVVLVDGDAPARALIRRGVGELRLLVRLSESPGRGRLEPWRWGAVPVPVLDPRGPGWRPLPDPVIIDGAGARRRGTPPVPLGEDPRAVLEGALRGAALRTDVVFLPHEGLDVSSFLSLCAVSRSIHPRGLRCALGIGDAGRWDQ